MKIIRNFLEDKDYQIIKQGLMTKTFWGYLEDSVDKPDGFEPVTLEDGTRFISSSTFRHMFIWQGEINSPLNEHMTPFYLKIKELYGDNVNVRSVFANMLPKTEVKDDWNKCFSIPHVDLNLPQDVLDKYDVYTALYYVNDSVGDTMFFKDTRLEATETVSSTFVSPEFTVSPEANTMVIWNGNKFHAAPAYVPQTRVVVNFNFLVEK